MSRRELSTNELEDGSECAKLEHFITLLKTLNLSWTHTEVALPVAFPARALTLIGWYIFRTRALSSKYELRFVIYKVFVVFE